MAHVGFRLGDLEHTLLKQYAKDRETTVSEIFRDYLPSIIADIKLASDANADWQIAAVNMFDISFGQFQYALQRSKTASEFFSRIATKVSALSISVVPTGEDYTIQIETQGHSFVVTESRSLRPIEAIKSLLSKIEDELAMLIMSPKENDE